MADLDANTLAPLLSRLRAHLTSAEQLADRLAAVPGANKRKRALQEDAGERKWVALAELGEKPIKWRKLRPLVVSEFADGEDEPVIWAVGDDGPTGGAQGVRGLLTLLKRTVSAENGFKRGEGVMECIELVVVLRGWLAGQQARASTAATFSTDARATAGPSQPAKAPPPATPAGPLASQARPTNASEPSRPPTALSTELSRPRLSMPATAPVSRSRAPLSGKSDRPGAPKFWVEIPPSPGASKAAKPESRASRAPKPKVNKRLASLTSAQPGAEPELQSYPTPDSSVRPASGATDSARSSSPDVVIVAQRNNWRPSRPSYVDSDNEGNIATRRASRVHQSASLPSPTAGAKYPHGTLVAVDDWFGTVALVWDRKWAEADWFGPRILQPELKADPASLVVVGVRQGNNWSYYPPDKLRRLPPWPPSRGDVRPDTEAQVGVKAPQVVNDEIDKDWRAASDHVFIRCRLNEGTRDEQDGKRVWKQGLRDQGGKGYGWDGLDTDLDSSGDEYVGPGGKKVGKRRKML